MSGNYVLECPGIMSLLSGSDGCLHLLGSPWDVSADLVHPSIQGVEGIARKWSDIMRRHLKK